MLILSGSSSHSNKHKLYWFVMCSPCTTFYAILKMPAGLNGIHVLIIRFFLDIFSETANDTNKEDYDSDLIIDASWVLVKDCRMSVSTRNEIWLQTQHCEWELYVCTEQ